jgi:molecular chaperone GrpE
VTGPAGAGDERASFGDDAGEMSHETEVEAPVEGASAPAEPVSDLLSDPTIEPESQPGSVEAEGPVEAEGSDVEGELPPSADEQLLERTADLQRLQAEFLNYKRRVDRDRELISQNATYKVLQPIVEVLDTIDRAREHGELEGGFKSVADQLERVVAGLGLTKFGAPGDEFDPTIHEALSHIGEDPDVAVTTAKVIAKSGYKINDRVVRAAQVLVVDPATPTE